MIQYCSMADIHYVPRVLALIQSLRENGDNSNVRLLALDDETYNLISELEIYGVFAISLSEIEACFPELVLARENRRRIEYIFTLTPFLIRWCVELSEVDTLTTYLDADLFFFSDPKAVARELEGYDIGLIPHQPGQDKDRKLRRYGIYNVGWVGFRNSDMGNSALKWWSERCLDWCGDYPSNGRFADQGYLDEFPDKFRGVKILNNRGYNLAPWNTKRQVITLNSEGEVTLGGFTNLVFFHFHGLEKFGKWTITSQLTYKSPASKGLVEYVYKPYLRKLRSAEKALEKTTFITPSQKLTRGKGLRKWIRSISRKLLVVASLLSGNAVDMSRLK